MIVIVAGATVAATQTTSNAGPILAFIGAVLVAMIAAAAAHRRQRLEIAAAEQRQQQALDAEAARLEQQLGHARRLDEVAHLRELVDEAAKVYEDADSAALELFLESGDHNLEEERFLGLYERASNAQIRTAEMLRRLQLRFPAEEALVTSWDALRGGFHEALEQVPSYPEFKVLHPDELLDGLAPTKQGFAMFCTATQERFI